MINFSSRRTFGVEFEFIGSKHTIELANCIRNLGESCLVSNYAHNRNNRDWIAKLDSSCGIELATRVMSGYKDIQLLGKVSEHLQANGFRFNNSCGMHIHIGASDFDQNEIRNIVLWWVKIEHFVFHLIEHHRRNNQYCKMSSKEITGIHNIIGSLIGFRGALNLKSLPTTIEFRLWHMSLDPEVVKNRVRFLVSFIEKCTSPPLDIEIMSPEEVLEFLNLLGPEELSDGMKNLRDWILSEFKKYAPSYSFFKKDHTIVNKIIQKIKFPNWVSSEIKI